MQAISPHAPEKNIKSANMHSVKTITFNPLSLLPLHDKWHLNFSKRAGWLRKIIILYQVFEC